MTDTIKISRDELQRIAQGCSCEVTTDALDALLATPPADAADMGGQAGEEVEVVRGEDTVFGRQYVRLDRHRRILAQHRQQAWKLVEALRDARSHIANTPIKTTPVMRGGRLEGYQFNEENLAVMRLLEKLDKTLADWEVKHGE